jgi:FMN-dependent NADH-azoreductase
MKGKMMNRVLLVLSSPRGAQSHSQAIARRLVDDIVAREPDAIVTERDLTREPLPHLGEAFVSGLFKSELERTREESEEIARSDALVDELLAADTIVIAAPMHNFGIPSTLKAWIDHVARAGRTFRYTASGPEGLLKGKRVILVVARGGVYTKGPATALEFQESYLRGVLGFLGLTDVQTIHVEGVAMGEAAANEAIERATLRAATLAGTIAENNLRVAA